MQAQALFITRALHLLVKLLAVMAGQWRNGWMVLMPVTSMAESSLRTVAGAP